MSPSRAQSEGSVFSRFGIMLSDWAERWFPDALVFAMIAVLVVFAIGLLTGNSASDLVTDFGGGFWDLIPFTMQMAMIIIGGYAVASAPPVARLVRGLASVPRTPRGAVAFIAFVSMTSSLVSWGFSLVFSALLVREIARRVKGVDYRAAGAAAYLGVGSVWALGLSSSAALLMATRESIPTPLFAISGQIPLKETIFTWQSGLTAVILIVTSVGVAYISAPVGSRARAAEALGIELSSAEPLPEGQRTPGEWLEHSGALSVFISLIGFAYIVKLFFLKGFLVALDLNTYNFIFIMLGLILHWRPRAFARSVSAAVPATAGVLIQFPFYAGIFGLLTRSSMSHQMADFFVRISNHGTFPLLIACYSAVLGLFVPSGGSKWLIEAPYILQAAKQLHVNLGWSVQIYNASEALPNLVNPFWMLPLLGLLHLRARQLVGYTALQLMVNLPLVLFLMWALARTFP